MKQKDVLTKNNDFLNVMFRGTPCMSKNKIHIPKIVKIFLESTKFKYYFIQFIIITTCFLVKSLHTA